MEDVMQTSINQLREDFYLADGILYRNYGRAKGKPVGSFDKSSGYWRTKYRGESWLVHRLVFLYVHGYLTDIVDHKDRDTHNNHPDNLRPTEYRGENTMNSNLRSDNTSGYKGVTWHKATNKWMSSVFYKGKRYHLGVFESKQQAAEEYNKKAKELFGEFAKLNEV